MTVIKFNLEQFSPVPAGERTLRIKDAKCVPSGAPKIMEVTFEDVETTRILKSTYAFDREGAMRALGFLCRVALSLPDMEEFDTVKDTKNLIGKVLVCSVVQSEGNQPREDGTFPIFANIEKVICLAENEKASINNTVTSPRNSIAGSDLD